ncbi:FRG domain-containing protein [Pseudomonas sp. DR48]|uniref:FRG domain-containing protein n=1 Tax=unclassified Pseudomonas TaxID=196821 RepID=UPI001C993E0B|nr:FRG domain-containing protein [Pseudomonas sp. DR48]QZP34288.1 FRG domain-containing protein [Pseudomonas sp. DR48]
MTRSTRSKKIDEATDLISYLDLIYGFPNSNSALSCYRGQDDKSWIVKPSVMRSLKADAENNILSELLVEAPSEFGSDRNMFDKLVRAQHYSLPTRLLDVTLNPLVGLYFACSDEKMFSVDGVVHVFNFPKNNVKFADSDTISIICNLARLSDEERTEISDNYRKVGTKISDWTKGKISAFQSTPEVKRLMQFVRVEKPYFLDAVRPSDLFRYYFVYPLKNNKRVIAQSGAFIAGGLLQYRAIQRALGLTHNKIIIPAASKPKIIKQLDTLNINSRSLFPEIEFASTYIKRKWSDKI